ncbi:MAG: ABC transporter permease [Acidobacteria bacterium]|nr:ABC transporter permease [Acidobacteriota bacterium]
MTARFGTGANVTQTPELSLASVTPGYLEALGTRLLRGRYFEEADEQRGDFVVLLSNSAATIFFNKAEAVGAQLPIELPGMRGRGRPTVVGVVADVKYSGLEAAPGPAVYVLWKELPAGQLYLAVKTQHDAPAVASSVRIVLRDVAPDMPVMPIRRLDEVMQRSVADRRLHALLGAGMAGVAFVIALAGLAAGLGRLVSERRRELAIRAALGASPRRMLRGVLLEGMLIALAGMALGTIGTLAAAGMLRALVFGISPQDPATLALVSVVVGAGAIVACYFPARRASTVDPLEVLRDN